MKYYKEEILRMLSDSGWELIQRDNETDWWLEEVWHIRSIKQAWGLRVYLHFLVDLQYDGTDKSSAVWCVVARMELAKSYSDSHENIANLLLQKGRFDQNIKNFVLTLNKYRNTHQIPPNAN